VDSVLTDLLAVDFVGLSVPLTVDFVVIAVLAGDFVLIPVGLAALLALDFVAITARLAVVTVGFLGLSFVPVVD
jgi:hypothetical protein